MLKQANNSTINTLTGHYQACCIENLLTVLKYLLGCGSAQSPLLDCFINPCVHRVYIPKYHHAFVTDAFELW